MLSLFPGIGMLDHAFGLEGFTVVRGPDVIWGGDIRTFHPPPGRFDGIIGGDPCQSHSSLANLVRAKGLEPSFPDMTPEFQRVVEEARPAWFLRENVPQAPEIKPAGYDVRSFLLDNSTLDSGDGTGNEQMRRRRWWFGVRDGECPELRKWIDFALFELPDAEYAVRGGTGGIHRAKQQVVASGSRAVPVKLGGSGKAGKDGQKNETPRRGSIDRPAWEAARKAAPVTGRNEGAVGGPGVDYSPPRRDLAEMLRLQGLPAEWMDHQPWTMTAKRKMVGNGVSIRMGRALARSTAAWLAS